MPFRDLEMGAQGFEVGDEMPGRVVCCAGVGPGFSAAALVKKDDTVIIWIEEGGVGLGAAAAWASVEIYRWSYR